MKMLTAKEIIALKDHIKELFSKPWINHPLDRMNIKTAFVHKIDKNIEKQNEDNGTLETYDDDTLVTYNQQSVDGTLATYNAGYTSLSSNHNSNWEHLLTGRIHHFYYTDYEYNKARDTKFKHSWEGINIVKMQLVLYWSDPPCIVHKSKKIIIEDDISVESIGRAVEELYKDYISRQTVMEGIGRFICRNITPIATVGSIAVGIGGLAIITFATCKVIAFADSYFI